MRSLIAIFVLLTSSLAIAERTTGNGGGLAEMKVIHLQQKLNFYVSSCSANADLCGLEKGESDELKAIATLALKIPLVISSTVSADELFAQRTSSIDISAAALYRSGVPKKTYELAAIVLASYWQRLNSKDKFSILDRATKITERFVDESASYRGFTTDILVHQTMLTLGGQQSTLLLIEDPEQTIDLSSKLKALSLCGSATQISITNWREARDTTSDLAFVADAASICEGSETRAVLVISLKLDSKELILPETVILQIRGTN